MNHVFKSLIIRRSLIAVSEHAQSVACIVHGLQSKLRHGGPPQLGCSVYHLPKAINPQQVVLQIQSLQQNRYERENHYSSPRSEPIAQGTCKLDARQVESVAEPLLIQAQIFLQWLAEFLQVPYELKTYSRDPQSRYAQDRDALVAVHPLGRSPTMTVDLVNGERLTIAEGGAIMTYLLEHHGRTGEPKPSEKSQRAQDINFWIHFGESK